MALFCHDEGFVDAIRLWYYWGQLAHVVIFSSLVLQPSIFGTITKDKKPKDRRLVSVLLQHDYIAYLLNNMYTGSLVEITFE